MAEKKAAAPKKAAPKKEAAPKEPAKKAAKASAAKKAAPKPEAPEPDKPRATPAGPQIPARTFVIPHDAYEAHKDEIKAPMKAADMKWSYLGEDAEGKRGIYRNEAINVFAHFKDDGVHYTVRGKDHAAADAVVEAWRKVLGAKLMGEAIATGAVAAAQEAAKEESEATRLWRLQEPQRRAGEPDFFYQKRLAEWEAQKPS